MSTGLSPEIVEGHRARIAAFVVRARRVRSHSLLQDLHQFQRWAEGTTVVAHVDGVRTLNPDVPPEEQFESLASRCRPFLLQGESVQWSSVLGSLRAFLKHDDRFGPKLQALRRSWASAVAPKPGVGFAVMRPGEVGDRAIWFSALANSWLYGDLVHADPTAQQAASGHSLNSRYRAAVVLYGGVAMHVVATLNLIIEAQEMGALAVDDIAFTAPATVTVPMSFPLVRVARAEAGTPMQDMLSAVDYAGVGRASTGDRTDVPPSATRSTGTRWSNGGA